MIKLFSADGKVLKKFHSPNLRQGRNYWYPIPLTGLDHIILSRFGKKACMKLAFKDGRYATVWYPDYEYLRDTMKRTITFTAMEVIAETKNFLLLRNKKPAVDTTRKVIIR